MSVTPIHVVAGLIEDRGFPYRWPGLSTHAWLVLNRAAPAAAKWIVRECIEERAANDPGATGDWCRQMVLGQRAAGVAS
jgi:hypothetical protein